MPIFKLIPNLKILNQKKEIMNLLKQCISQELIINRLWYMLSLQNNKRKGNILIINAFAALLHFYLIQKPTFGVREVTLQELNGQSNAFS